MIDTAGLQLNSTQIPNVLIDEWLPKLSGNEFVVLMVIARQTYGWHKDSDRISYSQLVKKTGISRRSIATLLKSLKEKKLINIFAEGQDLSYSIRTSANITLATSANFAHTKETNTKETIYHLHDKGEIPVKVYGNPDINRILEEFTKVTGLDKPSDKNPRFSAKNFLQSKERSVADFLPALEFLYKVKGYDLTSISAVTRHFSEYKRDILKKRELSTPEEFKGFI